MNRQELIEVYKNTVERSYNFIDTSITNKYNFDDIKIGSGSSPNVIVINSDTVSAGVEYVTSGKTCVLNMASYKRPGGGVSRGTMAQEECLFRCSTLNRCIPESLYPLQQDEGIYTKDAIFFKGRYYGGIKPIKLDVVTISAVNMNYGGTHDKSFEQTQEYECLMKNKIRLMLSMSIGCDNIILGAWGCGVFGNNPSKVAEMFKSVIDEGYDFNNIVFAIINDDNSVDDNYNIFKTIIN